MNEWKKLVKNLIIITGLIIVVIFAFNFVGTATDSNEVAGSVAIGGLATLVGGYLARKRKKPEDKLDPPFDDGLVPEPIRRADEVVNGIEVNTGRIAEVAGRSYTSIGTVAGEIEDRTVRDDRTVERIREQIEKNNGST